VSSCPATSYADPRPGSGPEPSIPRQRPVSPGRPGSEVDVAGVRYGLRWGMEVALGVLKAHVPMSMGFAIQSPDGACHNEPGDFVTWVDHKGVAHLEPAAIVATDRHEVITTNAQH
jgi:hypothetical protein